MGKPTLRELEEEMYRLNLMQQAEMIVTGGLNSEISEYIRERKIKVAKIHVATLMNGEERERFLDTK